MSVRVRFAPSPTGSPHVGNIRTALFNHLFAKHHGGVHILRIEDTDRTRLVPGCEEEIIESLHYVGVEWQEGLGKGGPHGPYRQSERKEAGIYQPIIDQLVESGAGYYAFDTSEELTEMREFQRINKKPTGYFGGSWRDADAASVEKARADGLPGVLRLRIPKNETIVIQDGIRGRVEIDSNTIDDPVLIKNDGMPTYHFAAMVDDHLMEITHVFRGEEWISSAPKHVTLFNALGWAAPEFVHVPAIKGKDGKKLSKRHGDTACLDFRRAGYLQESISNFIALIGWAPGGDREIMTMDEMAEAFSMRGIQPSAGVFDVDKLNWMNGSYIRAMEPKALFQMVRDYSGCDENQDYWAEKDAPTAEAMKAFTAAAASDPVLAEKAIELEQERVGTLPEFGAACALFFEDEPEYDEKMLNKWKGKEHIPGMLGDFIASVEAMETVNEESLEQMIRDWAAANDYEKIGPIVHPTRLAMTGRKVGPGLWQLMAALGKETIIKRLTRGQEMLT
jgi:glutamyl-tRNA synthetase